MKFVPWGHLYWIDEHDKLIRRNLAGHESGWRNLTGFRRLFARLRAERYAWKYAQENLKRDKDGLRKLY